MSSSRTRSRDIRGNRAEHHEVPLPIAIRSQIAGRSDAAGIDIDRCVGRVVCSDFELLVRLVTHSTRFFTAGPIFSFAPEIASGQLRVLDTPIPFRHRVAMHMNGDAYPLPAVSKVQQIIRDVFGSIVSRRS
jgi:hypothetical protein